MYNLIEEMIDEYLKGLVIEKRQMKTTKHANEFFVHDSYRADGRHRRSTPCATDPTLLYWALRVRMLEVREQATLASMRAGREPGESAGKRTATMRLWCSMGRTLLNVQMLVFNMGERELSWQIPHRVNVALIKGEGDI